MGIHGCPNGHSAIKVQRAHSTRMARVTMAVLVICEREPQYFPNLDVAKSAAAAPRWRGHQALVIDGLGNLHSKISVSKATHMVQPPHFEGPNVAVETLFGMWDSFRTSKTMWRPNPEMPRGDVTPDCCLRALTVAQLNEQRPVKSVPPTRPLDPKVKPAAPHVDEAAFPALPPSSHEGIGGIPGTKDFPLGTTEGFGAFKKPDADTVMPHPITGKTDKRHQRPRQLSLYLVQLSLRQWSPLAPPPLRLQVLPPSLGSSHCSQKSLWHGCPHKQWRMPVPNSLPRPTRTSQGMERPAARTLLQRSPWTTRIPMSVDIGVAHTREYTVPGPSPLPVTRKGKVQKARVP